MSRMFIEMGIIACRYGLPPGLNRHKSTFSTVHLSQNRAMDFNRFTEKLQEAIRSAQSKAVRYGNQQIDVEHLLAALLEQQGGVAPSILAKAGIQVDALIPRLEA